MKELGRPADQNFKKGLGTRLQNGGPRGPTCNPTKPDMIPDMACRHGTGVSGHFMGSYIKY